MPPPGKPHYEFEDVGALEDAGSQPPPPPPPPPTVPHGLKPHTEYWKGNKKPGAGGPAGESVVKHDSSGKWKAAAKAAGVSPEWLPHTHMDFSKPGSVSSGPHPAPSNQMRFKENFSALQPNKPPAAPPMPHDRNGPPEPPPPTRRMPKQLDGSMPPLPEIPGGMR